jgi:hypothetical protein
MTAEDEGKTEASAPEPAPTSPNPAYAKPGIMTPQDYGYGDAPPSKYPHGYSGEGLPSLVAIPYLPERRYTMPEMVFTLGTDGSVIRRSSMRQEGSSRRNSITPKGEMEITLPPTKKGDSPTRVIRRTSLTFKETAVVRTIEPAHSLSSKTDLWFQDDEIKQIQQEVTALVVQNTQNGRDLGTDNDSCVRGLESLMHPETTYMKRGVAWDAVFNEQYLQLKEGVLEEHHMANLYKFSSMRSRRDAVLRAMQDEREVAKYLQSTRRTFRHMSM